MAFSALFKSEAEPTIDGRNHKHEDASAFNPSPIEYTSSGLGKPPDLKLTSACSDIAVLLFSISINPWKNFNGHRMRFLIYINFVSFYLFSIQDRRKV